MLVHWDDVEPRTIPDEVDPLAGTWRRLGDAAGSVGVGVNRVLVPEGKLMTPPHVHSAEEEIFFVLAGRGLLWQDGATCEVSAGDCVVHRPLTETHTLVGGAGGLDVLVFGLRDVAEAGYLARSQRVWVGRRWPVRVESESPWTLESELGLPELPEPGERPANVVGLEDAPTEFEGRVRPVGRAAGAVRAGLNHVSLDPGHDGAPAHCHSLEEEVFVILAGGGTLFLTPSPRRAVHGVEAEEHALRPGHVIARPPGTGICHSLVAGQAGLTYLVYGTREPNDMTYYPETREVFLRGLGVLARLEDVSYTDGED
ncbi:MAG TPA: cupin domain-containing protein [Gaiellaceae bacterium]